MQQYNILYNIVNDIINKRDINSNNEDISVCAILCNDNSIYVGVTQPKLIGNRLENIPAEEVALQNFNQQLQSLSLMIIMNTKTRNLLIPSYNFVNFVLQHNNTMQVILIDGNNILTGLPLTELVKYTNNLNSARITSVEYQDTGVNPYPAQQIRVDAIFKEKLKSVLTVEENVETTIDDEKYYVENKNKNKGKLSIFSRTKEEIPEGKLSKKELMRLAKEKKKQAKRDFKIINSLKNKE